MSAPQAAAERLREVDRMKSAFLAAVSHEVRTPLTSVLGFAQVLAARGDGLAPERRRRLLERLLANAQRLESLLIDLLDVDRLERGALELRARPADVTHLVTRVLENMDTAPGRVRLHGQSVTACVDAPRIERIVESLVVNGLRHGGEDPVEVRVSAPNGHVELRVEDRGPGVPDADKERIFAPFEFGDSPAAKVGGAGIGLTVARALAALHGGELTVEDRPGGGASFVLRLPRDERPSRTESPAGRRLATEV